MASSLKDIQVKQVTVTTKEGKKRITPQLLSHERTSTMDTTQPSLVTQSIEQRAYPGISSRSAVTSKTTTVYHPRGRISRLNGSNVYRKGDIVVEIR